MKTNASRPATTLLWAAVALTGLIGLGGYGLASHQAPAGAITASAMSLGATTTSTLPPTAMPTPKAIPAMKAVRPKGF